MVSFQGAPARQHISAVGAQISAHLAHNPHSIAAGFTGLPRPSVPASNPERSEFPLVYRGFAVRLTPKAGNWQFSQSARSRLAAGTLRHGSRHTKLPIFIGFSVNHLQNSKPQSAGSCENRAINFDLGAFFTASNLANLYSMNIYRPWNRPGPRCSRSVRHPKRSKRKNSGLFMILQISKQVSLCALLALKCYPHLWVRLLPSLGS
jgi:hypothetical protein